jgi:hypothetical protein
VATGAAEQFGPRWPAGNLEGGRDGRNGVCLGQPRERLQLQLDDNLRLILKVTAWHDNTAAKKSNPDPNQWGGWGDRTVDEMAHAWINIVYMKDDDFKIEQDKRRATQMTANLPQ